MKWLDWLKGEPQEDFGAEPVAAPEVPKKKERGYFAESKEDKAASEAALKVWDERATATFLAYKPKGGEFRIRQEPAGHFIIQRRETMRATSPSMRQYGFYGTGSERWAEDIEKASVEAYEIYETVKNTDAPIMTRTYSSPYAQYRPDRDSLTGYADLAFNVFADAEAYLQRMAAPAEHTTEYDFPPLKKRVKQEVPATARKAVKK